MEFTVSLKYSDKITNFTFSCSLRGLTEAVVGWTVGAVDTGDNSLLSFLTRTEGAAETVSVTLDSCFTVVTILDTTELELDKRKTM